MGNNAMDIVNPPNASINVNKQKSKIKIAVVGYLLCGKTNVIHRYLDDRFSDIPYDVI